MGSRKGGEPVPGTKNLWGVEILKIRIDYTILSLFKSFFLRKNCSSTNWRVLKTIRLNRIHLKSWIMDSDIKVKIDQNQYCF